MAKVIATLAQFEADLAFVPNMSEDLLSSTTITPEHLPLAEEALEVAEAAPDVMRRATPLGRLAANLAIHKKLQRLAAKLGPLSERLKNALNVVGSDIMFDAGNTHEDVEKDNGETTDPGPMRTELDAYYRRPGTKNKSSKGIPGTTKADTYK